MCECGCASFVPDYRMPGPDGTTYFLSLRPPCTECHTPVGLIVERLTPAQVASLPGYSDLVPKLPMAPNITDWPEVAISLVEPAAMRKALKELTDEQDALDLQNIGDRDVAQALGDAFRATRDEWKKRRAKAGRFGKRASR